MASLTMLASGDALLSPEALYKLFHRPEDQLGKASHAAVKYKWAFILPSGLHRNEDLCGFLTQGPMMAKEHHGNITSKISSLKQSFLEYSHSQIELFKEP